MTSWTSPISSSNDRRAELAANLLEVRGRITRACVAAGRAESELTLIAVTKFFPVEDAVILSELGVADLGENRDQEASAKAAELATRTSVPVRWHFLGQLQTNKTKRVARYADVVQSVDRPALAAALNVAAEAAGRGPLKVLIQVDLGAGTAAGRGGCLVAQVPELAALIAAQPWLTLGGVMAIAPVDTAPVHIEPVDGAPTSADPDTAFAVLAGVSDRLRADYPAANIISAGMSADLEAAVRHRATHLRIGTALLGRRSPNLR